MPLNDVKKLSVAASTQARVANRLWLALIVATLFVLLPRASRSSGQGTLDLPFQLGSVPAEAFYLIAFPMLAVFLIAFCTAHAEEIRATVLVHRILDALPSPLRVGSEVDSRDLFDLYRLPSLSRVAPLPQAARGKYQFYPEARFCPVWLRGLTAGYYLVLKLLATFVYLILPGWAVWHTGALAVSAGWPRWGLAVIGAPAGLAFGQTILTEVLYVFRVMRIIAHGPADKSNGTHPKIGAEASAAGGAQRTEMEKKGNSCQYCSATLGGASKRCRECGSWLVWGAYIRYPETVWTLSSVLVAVVAAAVAWVQATEALGERRAVEDLHNKINTVADQVTKMVFLAADGMGRWGGIPQVHLEQIERYKAVMQPYLRPGLDAEIKNTIRELDERIQEQNKPR